MSEFVLCPAYVYIEDCLLRLSQYTTRTVIIM